MDKALIPYAEALPVLPEIFVVFEQLFFLIHIILINSLFGLCLIFSYKWLKKSQNPNFFEVNQPFSKLIPILFAFGINMAIPALLFIQVVFGHLFYTSSILIGSYWILIIPLLIVAYYSSYIHYKKFQSSQIAKFALFLIVLIVLYISFILVNNLTLMEMPEYWSRYFSHRSGTVILFDEISIYPRYFHFIMASLAVGGLFMAVFYRNKHGMDDSLKINKISEGLKIFGYATIGQMIVGVLFLLSLPREVFLIFMGRNSFATFVLATGVFFALLSLFSAFKNKLSATLIFIFLTFVSMVINRYNLRIFQLGENFDLKKLKVVPQWDVFAVFLGVLIIGVAVIVYMLKISFSKEIRK